MSRQDHPLHWLRYGLALAMLGFHLYVVFFGPPQPIYFRGSHLLLALVLIAMFYPSFSSQNSSPSKRKIGWLADAAFLASAVAATAYMWANIDYFQGRFALVDDLFPTDYLFGILMVLAVLEGARRTTGVALPLTALAFGAYAFLFGGAGFGETLDQLYMTQEGIFGIPLTVAATYILLFVVFGSLVEATGTGKLFMDIALAIAGASAGGPAKVAVMTSALFGTISGSSTANVVTTGTFTIPLMKRIGYKPAFAGAVEAVASTGGQIMPPIMGAAAFVMAEFLGVGYVQVILFALLPALLYFLAVFVAVHFEAKRLGLRGVPKADLPAAGKVLRERGHQFLPLVVIIGVMLMGRSTPYAATAGLLSVVPVAMLRKTTREGLTVRKVLDGCVNGVVGALQVSAACACAGIVIGVIALSGIGYDFTFALISMADQSLLLALVLTAIAGIILGMGLPTTPAYIVQAALLAPALVKFGVAVPAAHMFVFYFAIISVITPPVAISLIAANGISGAGLWQGGIASMRLAATGYIVPFMFVYGPALLLIGDPGEVVLAALTAIAGVVALSAGLHGYFIRSCSIWERLLLISGSLTLIKTGLVTDVIGAALLLSVIAWQTYGPTPNPVSSKQGEPS